MIKPLVLSNDAFTEFYSELCDVVERDILDISTDDPFMHTSDEARHIARIVYERMTEKGYLEIE